MIVKLNAVIQNFEISLKYDFLKLELVLLDELKNFFSPLTLHYIQVLGSNIHLDAKCLPVSLDLDKVPKLFRITDHLKNVEDLTTHVAFP